MPDNKVQEIADEITAYKPNTTFSLVKAVLEDLNAPFPEETKFYLKKLFGNIGVAYGTGVNINVVTKQGDNYILIFSGQPFSYIEINDTVYRFPESGSLTVTVKQDAENPFPYAKILWVPMNKNLPEGYEKPEESKYLENCSKNFAYPVSDDSEHRNKNYVKFGYIFYDNLSELLFSDNVSIYPDQDDPKILKVSGLLPNKKYEINGVKFTADSGGIGTIEDGVRLAETFSEIKETIDIQSNYKGKFKDVLHSVKNVPAPDDGETIHTIPSVFGQSFFINSMLFSSSNSDYSHHIINRYYEPLEVEYLGETFTIPVGQKSMEFDDKIRGSMLSKIKPGQTEVKVKIKNNFKYPWKKEQRHDRSNTILDKSCIQQLFNNDDIFYQWYTFDELKEFVFDGNKVNLQKNDYGYNTEINKYVYVIDNIFETLEETDESGAIDLINSQNLPKNFNALRIVPFMKSNNQNTSAYNYNINSSIDQIKSVNSIKAYKQNGSYHLIINYNTATQNNLIFKLGEYGDFINASVIENAIGFVIKSQVFDSL
jgi:hypothetical protein